MTAMGGLRLGVMAAAVMGVLSTPALAQRWLCDLALSDLQMGWISKDIAIDKLKDGSFVVQDRVMRAYGIEKVTPTVVEDTDKRIVLRWPVDAKSDTGQTVRMAYRATLYLDSNKIRLYGKDGAFSNDFEARGTCKVS